MTDIAKNQPNPKPKASAPPRTFSLRIKLLIAFILLFTVVFAAAYYWFYQFAVGQAITQIQSSLKNSLIGATEGVNYSQLLQLNQEAQPDKTKPIGDGPIYLTSDPRYQQQLDWLQSVHNVEPRAWPYIYIKGDETGTVVVLADLWTRYDANRAYGFKDVFKPKRPYFIKGLSDFTFNTNDDGSFRIYTDEWGTWTTAYAPIYDTNHNVVAAIGMDFEAQSVYDVENAIKNAVVPAFGLTYLVLFVAVLLISRLITASVIKLTRIAERIAVGDYKQDLSSLTGGRLPDEIGILAQVFQTMVDQVRQREETLKQEVVQLRIEIDESKKASQVSEIVESEFFKDLTNKAKLMRNRRNGPPPAAAESPATDEAKPDVPNTIQPSPPLSSETTPGSN